MHVTMLGVGRSGTTALYNLLQEILTDAYCDKIEFVYEPFLWDRDVFNIQYKSITTQFENMESLSIEGIYANQQIPLFVNKGVEIADTSYIESLYTPRKEGNILLLKFIRANGRYRLLKEACPQGKCIFVIRNPVDVVNSVINMFSFFGDDFHKSDFSRFATEVKTIYHENLKSDYPLRVEREVLYWYYMNRFALESFADNNYDKPLLICYESFVEDKERYIRKICDYLEIACQDKYFQVLKKTVGYSSREAKITEQEYQVLEYYLVLYQEMLNRFAIENSFSRERVEDKYRDKFLKSRPDDKCFGKTPPAIKNYWFHKHKNIKAPSAPSPKKGVLKRIIDRISP